MYREAAMLVVVAGLLGVGTGHAEPLCQESSKPLISMRVDTASARAILDLLDVDDVTDEHLHQVAALDGNQALVRQVARFDQRATEESFQRSLREMVERGEVAEDIFALNQVRTRAAATRILLERAEADPAGIQEAVARWIHRFTPEGLKLETTVFFLAGGTSDGFAGPEAFHVALHYFGDDWEGLILLMAHELFHNIQRSARLLRGTTTALPEGAPAHLQRTMDILLATLDEGTASLAADPLEVKDGKAYTRWFQSKYRRNLNRIALNFSLLDTLIYRAYHDPGAPWNHLYGIGFSGALDSPVYFVGYRMAQALVTYKGDTAISEAIGDCPIRFFKRYIALTREYEDPDLIPLAPSTERILHQLDVALGGEGTQ